MESTQHSRATAQASSSYANDLDIMGFAETQLLSETEFAIRVRPPIYLRMLQMISEEIFRGNVIKNADAYRLFKLNQVGLIEFMTCWSRRGLLRRDITFHPCLAAAAATSTTFVFIIFISRPTDTKRSNNSVVGN
ncbi:hypothetical protein REPUB_Repub13aG0283800 [Reevesia pubescens]